MNQKELSKTFMMISNENPLGSMVFSWYFIALKVKVSYLFLIPGSLFNKEVLAAYSLLERRRNMQLLLIPNSNLYNQLAIIIMIFN